jgi:hypothetical protein
MESPKDFQTHESRLIVACLTTASGQLPKRSLHLIAFQWVPCTLFNSIVLIFLAKKLLHSGFLNGPLPFGMRLEDSPEGRHIFDRL